MDPQGQATSDDAVVDPRDEAQRAESIEQAARLGQQRAAQEKAIKEKIRDARSSEEELKQAQMLDAIRKKEDEDAKKKDYRKMMKKRDEELAADKKRREKQFEAFEKDKKIRDAKRKKEHGYMNELHENARIKQTMEKRENMLQAQYAQERMKADRERHMKAEQAEHANTVRKEQLERDARARKSVIDTDAHGKEYQLENWKRSQMAHLESEAHGKMAFATGRNPHEVEQKRAAIDVQMKAQKKKLEKEWQDRKDKIALDAHRRKSDIDTEFYTQKTRSETQLVHDLRDADNNLARRYEEIEGKFKKLFYNRDNLSIIKGPKTTREL